jgi:hypothetical protein
MLLAVGHVEEGILKEVFTLTLVFFMMKALDVMKFYHNSSRNI